MQFCTANVANVVKCSSMWYLNSPSITARGLVQRIVKGAVIALYYLGGMWLAVRINVAYLGVGSAGRRIGFQRGNQRLQGLRLPQVVIVQKDEKLRFRI